MGQEKVLNSYVGTGLEVAGLDGEQFCQLPRHTGKHASQPR